MKKRLLITLIMSFVICSISGCAVNTSSSEAIDTQEIETEETKKQYSENPDITIMGVTKINNQSNGFGMVFKSTSDKAIKDIEMYYALYDENMMLVGSSYKTQKFESANIVKDKDKTYIISTDGTKYSYVNVIVGKISFEDGTTWQFDNPDQWLKDVSENKEQYKLQFESMDKKYEEYALKAENYKDTLGISIDLQETKNAQNNGYDLNVTITNHTDNTISDVQIRAALYLQNKTPAKVNNTAYATAKDIAKYNNMATLFLLGDNVNIAPGTSYTCTNYEVLEEENMIIKCVPVQVKYLDGTSQDNMNVNAWSAYRSFYHE